MSTSANEKAGQSGRKSVKSGSKYVFPTARGRNGVHRLQISAIHGFCAFFPTRNTPKKRDILSGKRESGMALKKREFTPESGTVDTYVTGQLSYLQHNSWHLWISFIIILVLPPGVVCSSNRALPMPAWHSRWRCR